MGGMFTFYLRMRNPLRQRGIEFNCVPPTDISPWLAGGRAEVQGLDGIPLPADPHDAMMQLIQHLLARQYQAVMVLPGCYLLGSMLPRYLPSAIRCVARIPMMTRGAYAPSMAVRTWLNYTVAVIDRISQDLMHHYGFSRGEIATIYNGVEVRASSCEPPKAGATLHTADESLFRILFAGRLEELQKNVMILPDILAGVMDRVPEARMCVIGDGPDRDRLHSAFLRKGMSSFVDLLGAQDDEMSRIQMRTADCLVLPSRYEGCPNTVLEAMAEGCVPVLSDIKGLSEVVVEHKVSGFIVPMNSVRAYVQSIVQMARDRSLRERMRSAVLRRVGSRFRLEDSADRYAQLLTGVMRDADQRQKPCSFDDFGVPAGIRPTWRQWVPLSIKRRLRPWAEKAGISL